MDKKIAIITGANSGMGKVQTEELAKAGFEVIMACKDIKESMPACEAIKKITNGSIEIFELNLASFASIQHFVENIKSRYTHLDLLLNNAGTLCHKPGKTEEEIEMTVGVNYLGHYYLTELLCPLFKARSRIVNMVSLTYRFGKIEENLFEPKDKRHFSRFGTYSNSKLALLYFTLDLAEKLKEKEINVNCADPGIVSTDIIRMGNFIIDKLCDYLYRPLIKTPEEGAETILYLALSDEVKDVTGCYFANKKQKKISDYILNHPQRQLLREKTIEILNKLT